jgi:hypothetical protein
MKRSVVNQNENDLAAGLVPVEVVARDAQEVLGDLAEFDQAEEEAGKSRPEQQLPRLLFPSWLTALGHLR